MTQYVLLAFLLTTLAGAVGTAYYRWRARKAEEAIGLLTQIGAQWRASNAQLQDRVRRAEAALKERHAREAAQDAAVQESAGSDARVASDLLNQLHQDGAGRVSSADGGVQRGAGSDVPQAPVVPVRRL